MLKQYLLSVCTVLFFSMVLGLINSNFMRYMDLPGILNSSEDDLMYFAYLQLYEIKNVITYVL